jgi:hypothetical protein
MFSFLVSPSAHSPQELGLTAWMLYIKIYSCHVSAYHILTKEPTEVMLCLETMWKIYIITLYDYVI